MRSVNWMGTLSNHHQSPPFCHYHHQKGSSWVQYMLQYRAVLGNAFIARSPTCWQGSSLYARRVFCVRPALGSPLPGRLWSRLTSRRPGFGDVFGSWSPVRCTVRCDFRPQVGLPLLWAYSPPSRARNDTKDPVAMQSLGEDFNPIIKDM